MIESDNFIVPSIALHFDTSNFIIEHVVENYINGINIGFIINTYLFNLTWTINFTFSYYILRLYFVKKRSNS